MLQSHYFTHSCLYFILSNQTRVVFLLNTNTHTHTLGTYTKLSYFVNSGYFTFFSLVFKQYFCRFIDTIETYDGWGLNCGPPVSEVTALPIVSRSVLFTFMVSRQIMSHFRKKEDWKIAYTYDS